MTAAGLVGYQCPACGRRYVADRPLWQCDCGSHLNLTPGRGLLRSEIVALAKQHFEKNLPSGVTLEMSGGHEGPWYLTDPNGKYGQAAQRALHKAFHTDVALIREGGSIPIVSDFREILGVETLLLGLALPGCRAHSPNENFPLENLDAGIRMNKAILRELAA